MDDDSLHLIASTSRSGLNALAFKGIMAYHSFPQIRAMLAGKFGESFALLFAKPVENAASGVIDWYTPAQGPVARLIDLPEEQRAPIIEKMDKMGGKISAYARELISAQDPLKETRGKILELILLFPSRADIYVIGSQPVITCWGFAPAAPGALPMSLSRLMNPQEQAPAPPPPPVSPPSKEVITAPAAPAARARSSWPLWLLLVLPSLLLLLFLLFASFGPLPALSGYPLFHVPLPEALSLEPDNSARINELRGQIDALRARLEKHAALCLPNKAAPAAPAAVKAPPEPTIKKPPSPQDLVIPENASDAGFMKGRWLCKTGLVNTRANEPVQMTFSFDENGKGEASIIEKDDQCRGRAQASILGRSLHIETEELLCSRKPNAYAPISIDCQNAEGSAAQCHGKNQDGSDWSAVFVKLRSAEK